MLSVEGRHGLVITLLASPLRTQTLKKSAVLRARSANCPKGPIAGLLQKM
jgi:hypothetical protein